MLTNLSKKILKLQLKFIFHDTQKMDTQKKITELEEKIAWLEDGLERQGQELTKALEALDNLQRQFKLLFSKVSDPYAVRDLKDEVPPPHY